jgi:hypothetical protein
MLWLVQDARRYLDGYATFDKRSGSLWPVDDGQ